MDLTPISDKHTMIVGKGQVSDFRVSEVRLSAVVPVPIIAVFWKEQKMRTLALSRTCLT